MEKVTMSKLEKAMQAEVKSILKGNGIDGRGCKLWMDGKTVVIEITKIEKFIRVPSIEEAILAPVAPAACMLCGGTDDIEEVTLYSNADGEDAIEVHHICQDGKGCNAVQEGKIFTLTVPAIMADMGTPEVSQEEPEISEPLSHQVIKPRIKVNFTGVCGEFHIDGADLYLIQFNANSYRVEAYRGGGSFFEGFIYLHEAQQMFSKLMIRMINGEDF